MRYGPGRDTIPTGSRLTLWAKVLNSVQLLWWVSIVAESALLFALMRRDLYRIYILFTAYIAADIMVSLGMMWLVPNTNSKAYARVWSVTEPVLILMQIAFAVELYLLISKHYRNFERVRPRLFWSCLLPALGISLLVLFIDMPAHWKAPLVQAIFLARRISTFALATFVVAVTVFRRIFPVPIRPNVTAHRRMTTVYFLSNALLYFVMNLVPSLTNPANILLMCLTGACFAGWAILLKPEGEAVEIAREPTQDEIDAHLRRGEELVRRAGSISP